MLTQNDLQAIGTLLDSKLKTQSEGFDGKLTELSQDIDEKLKAQSQGFDQKLKEQKNEVLQEVDGKLKTQSEDFDQKLKTLRQEIKHDLDEVKNDVILAVANTINDSLLPLLDNHNERIERLEKHSGLTPLPMRGQ